MSNNTNILMVYPEFPPTYWGSQYYLPLIGKKAAMPPLGLITIAAMTPDDYDIRLVDLNCEPLSDDVLAWADMVCFSAMLTQKSSLFETAERAKAAGKLVIFGGPFPTGTPLFKRMKQTGRLIEELTGDEDRTIASGYTNIVTRIPRKRLLEGHLEILQDIYTPENYFNRCFEVLSRLPHPPTLWGRIRRFVLFGGSGARNIMVKLATKQTTVRAMLKQYKTQRAIYKQFPEEYRKASRTFTRSVFRHCPDQILNVPHFITLGYHYYRFTNDHVTPGLTKMIEKEATAEPGDKTREVTAA